MEHHFNVNIAQQFNVNIAIFLNNIAFWIIKNSANRRHFYDGHYWTYNSTRAFSELFPYWSEKQIRLIISQSVKNGLLIEGNYNKSSYDRTKWFALTKKALDLYHITVQIPSENDDNPLEPNTMAICPNGQMDVTKRANGSDQKGRPIPDSNTDRKTTTTTESSVSLKPVVVVISEKTDKRIIETFYKYKHSNPEPPPWLTDHDLLLYIKWAIDEGLKEGYTEQQRIRGNLKFMRNGNFEIDKSWIKLRGVKHLSTKQDLYLDYHEYKKRIEHDVMLKIPGADKINILTFDDWSNVNVCSSK